MVIGTRLLHLLHMESNQNLSSAGAFLGEEQLLTLILFASFRSIGVMVHFAITLNILYLTRLTEGYTEWYALNIQDRHYLC